ncbi:MAG TPA: glycosyltransferase [Ignavibacteria bacterium]|nr:glycosyltransferase [Ignavibacteria bacterium]
MEIFLLVISLLYLILHGYLLFGLSNSINLKSDDKQLPFVSVIIAARNEKDNITRCINSLKKIKYDKSLYEIILVNDKSTDNTKELMYLASGNDKNIIIIDSRNSESSNLKGKANAIDTAIEIAKGDIILTSDADCEISPDWIIETAKYYDSKTAMVCGFTNIKYTESLFFKMQALDWVYLLSLASGSTGINNTLSCIGNNLSFRKSVYLEVGGYEGIEFSVTEDFALMRAIFKLKKYKIKYPVNEKSVVWTEGCKDLKTLYKQKKRWLKGGLKINLLGYIIGFELYIMNLTLIFGLFFLDPLIYIALIAIKFFSELLIMIPVIFRLKLKNLFQYFLFFEIYFAVYGLLLPFSFLFGNKIDWKGRKF